MKKNDPRRAELEQQLAAINKMISDKALSRPSSTGGAAAASAGAAPGVIKFDQNGNLVKG